MRRYRSLLDGQDGTADLFAIFIHPSLDGNDVEVGIDRLGFFGIFGLALDDLHGLIAFGWHDADFDFERAFPC